MWRQTKWEITPHNMSINNYIITGRGHDCTFALPTWCWIRTIKMVMRPTRCPRRVAKTDSQNSVLGLGLNFNCYRHCTSQILNSLVAGLGRVSVGAPLNSHCYSIRRYTQFYRVTTAEDCEKVLLLTDLKATSLLFGSQECVQDR